VQHLIGGMLTPPHILLPTPLPGRSSTWTLGYAPDNAAMEHLSHWFDSFLGPYRIPSTKGIQEKVPRKVDRTKPRHVVPPNMVRVLLQPWNGGELGNRNLASILESHGWALKSPWNHPFYPSFYYAGLGGERGGEWVTVGWFTSLILLLPIEIGATGF
jgi:hypothetical protein